MWGARGVPRLRPARAPSTLLDSMAVHDLRSAAPRLAGFVFLLGGLLGGCDNPACIFSSDGCTGATGGTLGENAATFPADGEWISPAKPSVLGFFPSAGSIGVDGHSPIVFVFSESMSPLNGAPEGGDDLASAFELTTTTGVPLPFSDAALTGDGRVLALTTSIPLPADSTFSILLKADAVVVDRTGQELQVPLNGVFGSFATPAVARPTPSVVATWPQDNATGQSQTSEIVVVFDRPMQVSTVDTSSFAVTVGGVPPPSNPVPHVVPLGSGGEARVFAWRSVDGRGLPVELGPSADVRVTLSPLGHQIKDTDGGILDAQNFEFTTAAFPAPVSAAITSVPTDAIGIAQISGPADLAVQVNLAGTLAGDTLVLTMIGGSPGVAVDPPLIAIQREVPLGAPSPSFTMTADEIDLLASSSPVKARLADGTIGFAFQIRRGLTTSPVRMLDVDTTQDGVQSPLLDTTPPHVVGLGAAGTSLVTLRSDLTDVAIFGRANERLTKALVTTALGDNEITPGVVPPVVGSDDVGTFIAAPVRLGVVAPTDLPLDFTLTIYDRAMNSGVAQSSVSDTTDGFRQLGASGPGTPLPGGNVTVEVFDATTFAPVTGAEVYVHQERLGSVAAVNTVPVMTGAGGLATLAAASTGTTIVTVRKTGYELFTFQGVPTSRLGIPLSPLSPPGSATGTVGPVSTSEASDLNTYTRSATDSRSLETEDVLFPVASCAAGGDPSSFECPFGPIPVQPGRLGAQTAVTVRFPTSLAFYSALTFLKTGSLALPVPAVLAGATSVTNVPVPFLLDDGTIDPEELPIDAPAQMLSTAAWPSLAGAPIVTIEAASPGLSAAVTLGQGVVFDDSPPAGSWIVRAAYPGNADGIQDFSGDRLGKLVIDGTIEADLFLGVSVADAAGNRADARPRFSALTGILVPPATPVLPATPITPNAGGQALDLTFPDVLPDSVSPPGRGVYRVRLEDSAGARWTVYVADPSDSAGPNVVVRLPELGGVFPLASGSAECRISGWSVPGLDLARFLWTDLARDHEVSFHSAAQTVSLP
jgi:hypothetical protein